MAEVQDTGDTPAQPARIVGSVRNMGDPIRLTNVEPLCGFSAEPSRGGQTVKIWTRLALTSDDPLFHRLTENFASVVNHMTQQAGTSVRLDRAETVLLVIKIDNTAELWLDTAAVSIRCAIKRDVAAGTAVFEHDIADVTGMSFPCVNFEATDRVLCIFRQDWRFAFAFDFNPDGKFDMDGFTSTLGTLYRELRYRHFYEALADQALFDRLIVSGWFPFVEIITSEFKDILRHCEADFDVTEIEAAVLAKFDETRLQRILDRWLAKPHCFAKEALLKAAIDAYNRCEPVAVIKILLTEIEGILNDAHRATHGGQGAKLKELLKFAVESAERKAGQPNTLLLPAAFAKYLAEHTFANFDPAAQTGTAGSRHAVGHGAAAPESYTMPRALQAILTLDQLAFYT
jgi:hypothetical protein